MYVSPRSQNIEMRDAGLVYLETEFRAFVASLVQQQLNGRPLTIENRFQSLIPQFANATGYGTNYQSFLNDVQKEAVRQYESSRKIVNRELSEEEEVAQLQTITNPEEYRKAYEKTWYAKRLQKEAAERREQRLKEQRADFQRRHPKGSGASLMNDFRQNDNASKLYEAIVFPVYGSLTEPNVGKPFVLFDLVNSEQINYDDAFVFVNSFNDKLRDRALGPMQNFSVVKATMNPKEFMFRYRQFKEEEILQEPIVKLNDSVRRIFGTNTFIVQFQELGVRETAKYYGAKY